MDINNQVINDVRWMTQGISRDLLKEILDSLGTGKNCEVIRSGYGKKLLKYTCSQGSFYIKQYIIRHGINAFKSFFSLSKARKEWNQGHLLLKNHILTAEPVAVGERRYFGILKDCCIISRAISNAIPAKEILDKIMQSSDDSKSSKKSIFLRILISYVGTVHDIGIFHGELHAENILVDCCNTNTFYLIDLGRIKFRKDISVSRRIKDLSRLLYSIRGICTNKEILELINNYASKTSAYKKRDIFQKEVFDEISRIKHRHLQGRIGMCLRNNDVFRTMVYNNYKIKMRTEWDVNILVALVNKHILSLNKISDNIIKVSSMTAITHIPPDNENMKSICIKEYRCQSFFKKLLYSFYNSPARKAWFAAHSLMAMNFLTARPIALLEERRFWVVKRSFFIMEFISHGVTCKKYVCEKFRDPCNRASFEEKRKFISCLALSLKQLHSSNIYHGDLKANNNLLVMESQNGWDFFYIDLDRVGINKKITVRKEIKSLSQLNASIPKCITYTDRLRFYKTYTGQMNITEKDKRIIKTIVRLSIKRNHLWK